MRASQRGGQARSVGLVVVIIAVLMAAGLGVVYFAGHQGLLGTTSVNTIYVHPTTTSSFYSSSTSTTVSTNSSSSTSSSTTLAGSTILARGSTYQVSSSFDCVAGHFSQNFTAAVGSNLSGAINATNPGVTLYVSTAQEALSISDGHPSTWVYDSGLTNSTSFNVGLSPGAYVLWIEGDDMGCGATVVEPLEMLTTVTVTQAILLEPS